MTDRYQQLVTAPVGRQLAGTLGLPVPVHLRRYEPGRAIVDGPVLVGAAGDGGRGLDAARTLLDALDAAVVEGVPSEPERAGPFGAILVDATGVAASEGLRAVYDLLHPVVRHTAPSGRVVLLAGTTDDGEARRTAAQTALDGLLRSLAKELRRGATANLVRLGDGAEDGLSSTLRFLLSGRSAFVSGQTITLRRREEAPEIPVDWDRPLADRVAVVTGAAQGIGASIAAVLARDGAHVVCLDVPAQGDKLAAVANGLGGSTLQLDITADEAPRVLVEHLRERHGGVDVVVHNAGITRDKTLAGMRPEQWDTVMAVNLAAQERINEVLADDESVLNDHARIVCISSLSGIAGNRGQTNYAASKAGVIGMVHAYARHFDGRAVTINAVAPGFIETEMTGRMPLTVREVGRRMNSLNQGGLPEDVAETVAWLAHPASAWVNGEVVRVCGQSPLGA
jgi:3-oxoacyl-[acyl-carrier protein] reductase